jgi:hypothetical protein
MCIAIVKPAGANVPSYDRILNSWESNQDGGGFAVQRKGKTLIKYEKGYFDMDKYYNKLVDTIKPEDTALIHMRITTHGGTSKECCHPFPISQDYDNMRETHGKCKKIMMHNGILGGAFGQVDKPGVSDTMELVKYLAKANFDTYGEGFQRLMEPILGSGNKVAVLTEDGYTLAGKGWIKEDDGCYYSNGTYEDYYSKYCGYNNNFSFKPSKAKKKSNHFKKKTLNRGYNKVYNYKKVDVTSLPSHDQDDILSSVCPSCLQFMPDAVYGDTVCKYCNIEYN